MMHGDIINHFHHNNGLAATSTTEESHFTTTWEGYEQVYYLDTCFQNVNLGILVSKSRCRFVNRSHLVRVDWSQTINRSADNIHDPAQGIRATGNHYGVSCVLGSHASHQAIGLVHGNTADDIVAKME